MVHQRFERCYRPTHRLPGIAGPKAPGTGHSAAPLWPVGGSRSVLAGVAQWHPLLNETENPLEHPRRRACHELRSTFARNVRRKRLSSLRNCQFTSFQKNNATPKGTAGTIAAI